MLDQWALCCFGDEVNVGSESKWNRIYLVLNDKGNLSLYGHDTMESVKGSFDLTLWTKDQIIESPKQTEMETVNLSMITDEGTIRFAFENEKERRKMLEAIKRFIGDENAKCMLHFNEK